MRIQYVAADNKTFQNQQDCIDYESNNSIVYVLERYNENKQCIDSYSIHSTNEDATRVMMNIVGPLDAQNIRERHNRLDDFKIVQKIVNLKPMEDTNEKM